MKAFYRLWLGDSISDVGTSAYLFVVPIFAVSFFGVTDSSLGVIMAVLMSAPSLLAFPLGVVADKAPMSLSLHLVNFIRFALMAVMLILFYFDCLTLVLFVVTAFIVEVLSLLYNLLGAALIPRIVESESLTRANSLTESANTVTNSAGEVAGGYFYAAFGLPFVLVFNGISYVASSLGVLGAQKVSCLDCQTLPEPADNSPKPGKQNGFSLSGFTRLLVANVKVWKQTSPVVFLTLNAVCLNLGIGVIVTLFVPYALHNLGISVGVLGLLSLPSVVLSVFAPAFVPYIESRFKVWGSVVLFSVMAGGGILVIFYAGFVKHVAGALILALGLALLDFAALGALIVDRSYRQKLVPQAHQAGVAGLIMAITWGCDPLAALVSGFLSTYVIGRQQTIGAATIFIGLAVLVMILGRKAWDKPDKPDTPNE